MNRCRSVPYILFKYFMIILISVNKLQLRLSLKYCFFNRQNQANTPAELLKKVFDNIGLRNVFPNILFLLTLANIIPTPTASVERIFSLMNSLCTPLRSRLTEGSLGALMRICSEAPTASQLQLDKIIDLFKNMKPRKLAL